MTGDPTTPLSEESIAQLAREPMDIGALTRITECTVQANGETWTVPAYWTDDEIVVYIATTITQRKKKHDDDPPKIKPETSYGGVRR